MGDDLSVTVRRIPIQVIDQLVPGQRLTSAETAAFEI